MLVLAGADINAQGENGFTPLHCAAKMYKPEAILVLRKLGARMNILADGETAMEVAESA